MARHKLTPMQFRRKYCKHEPKFALEPVTPVMIVAVGTAKATANAKAV